MLLHRNEIVRARPDNLILCELDGRSGAVMPNEHLRQDMFQRELGDWLQAIHSGGYPFVSGASATTAIRIIGRRYHRRRPLLHALLLASRRDEAIGKTFLISGPEPPTWLEFYSAYAKALGRKDGIRLLPYDEINRRIRSTKKTDCYLFPLSKRWIIRHCARCVRHSLHYITV